MKELLELKWDTCTEFVQHLEQTGQSSISHPVKDMFWGNGSECLDSTCDGADYFSVLLMQLRDAKRNVSSNWVVPNRHERKQSQELKMKDWVLPPLQKEIAIIGDLNFGSKYLHLFIQTVKLNLTQEEKFAT